MIGIREAAERLGVHPVTLRAWCKQKLIEHLKFGNRIKFTEEAIAKFVESCKVTT